MRLKRHRYVSMLCLLFVPHSFAQMSHEETAVRTAYAKLAYAVELNQVYKFAQSPTKDTRLADRVVQNAMQITLSNVRSGDLRAIEQEKYSDLVTEPDGRQVLETDIAVVKHAENGSEVSTSTAETKWQEGQTVTEDWSAPMAKMLPIIEAQNGATYSTFVAYTVTASYQNKQNTYKALWLFGHDKQGNALSLPIDTMIGIYGGALYHVATHPVYPAVLLDRKLRNTPGVSDWFAAQVWASCKSASDVCCDPETLRCGIAAQSLGGNQ